MVRIRFPKFLKTNNWRRNLEIIKRLQERFEQKQKEVKP
jgi:hypothetical protein